MKKKITSKIWRDGVWVLHSLVSHSWGLGPQWSCWSRLGLGSPWSCQSRMGSGFSMVLLTTGLPFLLALHLYYSVGIHVNQHFLLPVFKDINWSVLMKPFSSLVRSWDTGLFHLYVCICILGTFYIERLVSS